MFSLRGGPASQVTGNREAQFLGRSLEAMVRASYDQSPVC